MNKNLLRYFALLILFSAFSPKAVYSQVNYNEQFNVDAAGWTGAGYYTGASACGGAGGAIRYNLYSGATTVNIFLLL